MITKDLLGVLYFSVQHFPEEIPHMDGTKRIGIANV